MAENERIVDAFRNCITEPKGENETMHKLGIGQKEG